MEAQKLKIVNKDWLNNRIAELNIWLHNHSEVNKDETRIKKHNRDYYVAKLIELEENNYKMIQL